MQHITERSTTKGPPEWFTGDVYVDPVAQGRGPAPLSVGSVHFTPCAHTAWHHGATAGNFMTQLAITEGDTEWGAHLTDADYPTAHGTSATLGSAGADPTGNQRSRVEGGKALDASRPCPRTSVSSVRSAPERRHHRTMCRR